MFKIIFWNYNGWDTVEEAMPYSPEHKRDTHQKILESARRLFNKRGFSEVWIDEIMDKCRSDARRGLPAVHEQGAAIRRGCSPVSLHRRAQALAIQIVFCRDSKKAAEPTCR